MISKVINAILILVAVFMGMKQGWAMASGKAEMLTMFAKWHFTKTGVMINGLVTMLSAILILFPKTFLLGQLSDGGRNSADHLFSFTRQRAEGCSYRAAVSPVKPHHNLLTTSLKEIIFTQMDTDKLSNNTVSL